MKPSPAELLKNADVQVTDEYSIKSWLHTAEQLKKNGEFDYLEGNLEASYVGLFKFTSIVMQLKKHSEFSKMDSLRKKEYNSLFSDMSSVVSKMESMKRQLQSAYEREKKRLEEDAKVVVKKIEVKSKETPATIQCQQLYDYLTRHTPPKLLVVDIRTKEAYLNGHLAGCALVNLEPHLLSEGVTCPELEQLIQPGYSRLNFEARNQFDLVVYMDEGSTHPDQTPELTRFVQAVKDFELTKVLKRTPALLVGGYLQWKLKVQSAPVRSGHMLLSFSDIDGTQDEYALMPAALVRSASEFVNTSDFNASMSQSQFPEPQVVFQNPFMNFTRAMSAYDQQPAIDTRINSYYPEAPQVPPKDESYQQLSKSSHPSAPPLKDVSHLPQTLPTIPNLKPQPEMQHRKSLPRAPSPPSPGQASGSFLTIHSLPEDLAGWTPSVGRGLCGLKNLGNTCYMNSTLQCLLGTRQLSAYFMTGSYRKDLNKVNPLGSSGQIAQGFAALLSSMLREDGGVAISPSSFKETITRFATQFKGTEQHDSQEFLAFLLDGLHEDLNQGIGTKGGRGLLLNQLPEWARGPEEDDEKLPEYLQAEKAWIKYLARNDSLIVQIFQGQLKSELKCQTCGKSSITFNPFMYLSLPIPPGPHVRLNDCLNEFIKDEILEEADSWKCPQCKVHRRATKKLTISRLPIILLVHLKRFSFQGIFRDKLDTFVDFPPSLDLFPFLSNHLRSHLVSFYDPGVKNKPVPIQKYELYAISNHFGGMNGGHYTASVKQHGRWFNFDDSRVTETTEERVKTKYAYSLYYVSVGAR